eukprot:705404-Pleurochrysis_carterae.AAC.1
MPLTASGAGQTVFESVPARAATSPPRTINMDNKAMAYLPIGLWVWRPMRSGWRFPMQDMDLPARKGQMPQISTQSVKFAQSYLTVRLIIIMMEGFIKVFFHLTKIT